MISLFAIIATNCLLLAAMEAIRRQLSYRFRIFLGTLLGLVALSVAQHLVVMTLFQREVGAILSGSQNTGLVALTVTLLVVALSEEGARLWVINLAQPTFVIRTGAWIGLLFGCFELLLAIAPRSLNFVSEFLSVAGIDGFQAALTLASQYDGVVPTSLLETIALRIPSIVMHVIAGISIVAFRRRWLGFGTAVLIHLAFNLGANLLAA